MSDKEKEKILGTHIEIEKEGERQQIHISNGFFIKAGTALFCVLAGCILFFFLIQRYEGFARGWHYLMRAAQPIIIGMVIAYLINPIMRFWERLFFKLFRKICRKEEKARSLARGVAITGAILVMLIAICLLFAMIVPSLITSVTGLAATLPGQVESFIKNIQAGEFGDSEIAIFASSLLVQVTDFVEQWLQNDLLPTAQTYLTKVTSSVFGFLKAILNFFIGIFVAIYVMMIQETLQGQAKKIVYAIFSPQKGNIIIHTVRKSSQIFGGFITGKLVDSLIIGLISYIACVLLQMPSAMLVATIIGVTNIIPFFGPFIGAVPTLLLVVIQSPWHALYLLIYIIVIQQVDGNIIGPKILGNSTGLSSFWVMFAILVFGGIWGFFGMLLGVPIMAVLYYIVGKLVRHVLAKRKLPTKTEEYILARGVNLDDLTLRYETAEEQAAKEENSAQKTKEKDPS